MHPLNTKSELIESEHQPPKEYSPDDCMRRLSLIDSNDSSSVASASPGLCVGEENLSEFLSPFLDSLQDLPDNMTQESSRPDVICGFSEVSLNPQSTNEVFKFIDEKEVLMVTDYKDFLEKLGCPNETDLQIKVVSIFGNTGEGKSHFLNHVFFKGCEVFRTSNSQQSCTMGVWAALSKAHRALVLDTEGMLGVTTNADQCKRMLLKVLAVSDIIIYRTRSERLHMDMYKFLAEASRAYTMFFKDDLYKVSKRTNTNISIGPPVFIFHDTRNTEVLVKDDFGVTPEEYIQTEFTKLGYKIDGFSSISYVGENCNGRKDTDFSRISRKILEQLQDTKVRAARSPGIVLDMLKTINRKFSGEIIQNDTMFPDEYFTCTSRCRACDVRCSLYMNHIHHSDTPQKHTASTNCIYKTKLDNKVYLCKQCDKRGVRTVVVPQAMSEKDSTWFGIAKLAWSGYVIECENCGRLYNSREHWYGNKDPDEEAVKTEYVHVWPGSVVGNSPNAGRHVMDGVAALGSAISSVSSQPAKAITQWLSDKCNPTYWKPNSECINCDKCKVKLTDIHHCRRCGLGFCDACSSNVQVVADKGWGDSPVRVCDICYSADQQQLSLYGGQIQDVAVRQVAEAIHGTISTVAKYPLDIIKDSTRPQYWIPDEDIVGCLICQKKFGPTLPLHHCRACGEGVCDSCSKNRIPVKERGWNTDVRVCNDCYDKRTTDKH